MIASQNTNQGLTIRAATPADAAAITRLAQLDSALPLETTRALVAELDGELVAALPREGDRLEGDRAIANPFRHTAAIVALLEARAATLDRAARPASRRPGLLRSLRVSLAGRA